MLAKRVADERERLGLKPAELAAMVGIKQPSLWAIEKGVTKADNIKAATLFKLADVFRCNPRWLLYGKGPRELLSGPLPHEAVSVAMDWQRIAPGLREDLAKYVKTTADSTERFGTPVADSKVASAYGTPPKFSRTSPRKTR